MCCGGVIDSFPSESEITRENRVHRNLQISPFQHMLTMYIQAQRERRNYRLVARGEIMNSGRGELSS